MRIPVRLMVLLFGCAVSFGCKRESAQPDDGVDMPPVDMAAGDDTDAALDAHVGNKNDAGTKTVAVGSTVTITNACDITAHPDAGTAIVYGSPVTNSFLGYGGNIDSPPGSSASLTNVMNVYDTLSLSWARFDYGNPFRENMMTSMPVPPLTASNADMYQAVYPAMMSWLTTNQSTMQKYTLANSPTVLFYQQLKARKIKVVSTIFEIPETYRMGGNQDWEINPATIPNLAQFFVAYYLSLVALGVPPDDLELVNEPDGKWEQDFNNADDYVTFVNDIQTGLADCQSYDSKLTLPCPVVGIFGPGTSNIHPAGRFLTAMVPPSTDVAKDLTNFAALSTHTYLLPPDAEAGMNTIYNSMSPAYDPVFAQLVAAAQGASKDLIMTEFGGRTRLDVSSPSDPSLLLKGALDLTRLGASAAFIWDIDDGAMSDPYALLSSGALTPLYYPMLALVPNIPAGARVLSAMDPNAGELMASLGFGAFAGGDKLVFGLANPSQDSVQVTVDLANEQTFSLDTAYGYTTSSVFTVPVELARTTCPVTFELGPYAGVVVSGETSP